MAFPINNLPPGLGVGAPQGTTQVQPGNVGGQQVQQVHGQPVALLNPGNNGHVDNATLNQVLLQLNQLQQQVGQLQHQLGQVLGQPQVNGGQVQGQGHQAPQVQQQVHERLMTFDDLSTNIGHRPHSDKLGGLWKMSEKYKAVEQSLNQVNQSLSGSTLGTIARDQNAKVALNTQLGQLVRDGEAYIAKHTGVIHTSAGDKAKIAAMREMVDQAKLAMSVLTDPDVGGVPQELTLSQALEIKQRGIQFTDCDFTFKDDQIDVGRSNLNFGAGNANTVQKLVYGQGPGAQTLIFKPEPDVDRNPLLGQKTLGIDLNAPHYGERNVASRSIDEALGGKTVVNSRMVMHDGHVGLLMDRAPGKMPGERAKVPVSDPQQRFIDGLLNANNGKTLVEKTNMLKSMEFVEVGGQWMKIEPRYADPFEGVPPTPAQKASVQQELCRLEWSDALTGQFDRHGQNYLIALDRNTNTATVSGIDNDLAFGKLTHGIPGPGPDPTTGYNGVGKPLLIDRATYDRMHNMDFDRDLLPALQGRISPEEIGATKDRFNELKTHAETLQQQGKVVDNWQTWTSPTGGTVTEFLTQSAPPATPPTTLSNSYYMRDIHEFT